MCVQKPRNINNRKNADCVSKTILATDSRIEMGKWAAKGLLL